MPILIKAAQGMIPRRPSQGNFNAMMRARQRELDELCMRLAKGELTIREWGDEFDKVLLDGHTRAHMLGRQRGGDLRELLDDDVLYGIASKDQEAYFLHGYMQALADGDARYLNDDGMLNPAKMRNRNSLYVGRMRGSASEAWESACPDDQQINWIMLAKEHCPDCPRMASLNPWDKGDLWAFPGSGDTQCIGNCRCVLRRTDGEESFRHPSIPADAPDIPFEAADLDAAA